MKAGTALAAIALILALAPASASAAQRWAAPGGSGVACTNAAPCDFETAVEGAADGDEVVVEPGAYTVAGEVLLDSGAGVHGVDGQTRPVVFSAAATALRVTHPGASLRWLGISHTGGGDALLLEAGEARTLSVQSTTPELACRIDDAALHDSICWATGNGGDAAGMVAATATERTTLTNVTAFASGAGSSGLRVQSLPGGWAELTALNVIASGTVDTEILSTPASITVANLDYSNFATQTVSPVNSFATPPGLAHNQKYEPQFADAANGDFHQNPDSTTIDAGTLGVSFSETDAYGESRVEGLNIDMGADEFEPPPSPPDTNPPDTRILKSPRSRTSRRVAKFKFGTTEPVNAVFMCRIDKKGFKPCKSPMKLRVKRRRHTFAVYSIDEAGNVDPTPDSYTWKVRRPPRDER